MKNLRNQDREFVESKALRLLVESLAEVVVELGISSSQLESALGETAVKAVARHQRENFGRINIAGIAATTNYSRSEISRILGSASGARPRVARSPVTARIVNAWISDSKFLTAHGRARTLKIYGPGATFETLVKNYGHGLPVRAILDELIRRRTIKMSTSNSIDLIKHTELSRSFLNYSQETLISAAAKTLKAVAQSLQSPETLVLFESYINSQFDLTKMREAIFTSRSKLLKEINGVMGTSAIDSAKNNRAVSISVLIVEKCVKSRKRKSEAKRTNLRRL